MRAPATASGPIGDGFRELHVAVARSLAVLDDRERARASALAELGDIALPDAQGPGAVDPEVLEPVAPLYLAYQLQLAGLLRTAELIAGLFASGSIDHRPLGAAAPMLAAFWRDRHTRLAQQERIELFRRVFEAPWFDRLLGSLMQAIARLGDQSAVADWGEAAMLEQGGEQLVDFLSSRTGGMVPFAARDITSTINDALHFLREPALLAAFSAHTVWELVRFAAAEPDLSPLALQRHLDLGKSGAAVLAWLAGAARSASLHIDASTPGLEGLVGAARSWLAASDEAPAGDSAANAPAAALVPMAPVAPAPLSPARRASS